MDKQWWYEKYKVDVPEGVRGGWKVERFTVSKDDSKWTTLSGMTSGRGYVPEGTYTQLVRVNGGGFSGPMMSDTPDEIKDHLGFIRVATGRVLIHGLGLGMCLEAAVRKEDVEHVLCIEKDPDVIALVAPHYEARYGDKIEIREDDAFTWKPKRGQRWDVGWHDIWATLCTDNLDEMSKLHRRFGRRCGWQGSWGKGLLRSRRRQEQQRGW